MKDKHDRMLEAANRFFKVIASREPYVDEVADIDAIIRDYLKPGMDCHPIPANTEIIKMRWSRKPLDE